MTSASTNSAPGALHRALTGLLSTGGPLPAALFPAAWTLLADDTAPLPARSALQTALAGHPGTPLPMLTALAELVPDRPGLAEALLGNAGAPAAVHARAAQLLAGNWPLRQVARTSTDPAVLEVLAARAGVAPRAKVTERWQKSGPDSRRPADECLWEEIAEILLRNRHLPVQAGRALVAACLPHLAADLAVADPRDGYAAGGENSITAPGVRTWLHRDRELAAELGRTSDHPWILAAAASLDDAADDVIGRAFWTLIAGPLSGGGSGRRVPQPVGSLIVALAGRLDAEQTGLLRGWLRADWNLDVSHTALKAIAFPPAPATPDEDEQLFATGDVAAALDRLAEIRAAGGRGPGHRAVYAFVARPDVPTGAALTVATAVNDHSRQLLKLRPFDREFCTVHLAGSPGWFDDVLDESGDADLVVAAMTRYHAVGPRPGRVTLREVVKGDRLLPRLGTAALRLPWPVLADLTGLDEDFDARVAASLAAAVAQPGAGRLLPLLADTHDGGLEDLVSALDGALGA